MLKLIISLEHVQRTLVIRVDFFHILFSLLYGEETMQFSAGNIDVNVTRIFSEDKQFFFSFSFSVFIRYLWGKNIFPGKQKNCERTTMN